MFLQWASSSCSQAALQEFCTSEANKTSTCAYACAHTHTQGNVKNREGTKQRMLFFNAFCLFKPFQIQKLMHLHIYWYLSNFCYDSVHTCADVLVYAGGQWSQQERRSFFHTYTQFSTTSVSEGHSNCHADKILLNPSEAPLCQFTGFST